MTRKYCCVFGCLMTTVTNPGLSFFVLPTADERMLAASLRSVLFLVLAAGARGAADVFDRALYRDALEPALCARQLAAMRRADFYDASFRAPEGLLVGNLASLGNYHQCLAINQDFPGTSIQGKYCLIRAPLSPPTVRIPSLAGASASENVTWTEVTLPEGLMQKFAGMSLDLAVCVPKACAMGAVLAPYTEHPVLGFNYTEQYCRLPDDKPFVAVDYVAIVIFSLLGVLTLISTAYELRHIFILKRDPLQASALLRACSLFSNTRRLLTFDKPRALDCLDGIRSLSILMIIINHNFLVHFVLSFVVNDFERVEWMYKRRALWYTSFDLAVDSFFTMSGLLLVYTSFNKMTQRSLLRSLHWFYLHRYLRLFPLLACAVLLQASLLHHAADGPIWDGMAEQVDSCRRYWWSALLHVQNIVNLKEICLGPAWYLSVEMQLYVASPLVLCWVLGSRRAAWAALAVATFASLAAALAVCIMYPSPISSIARGVSMRNMANYRPFYYKNTFVRAPPFVIGMLLGYILHCYRGVRITMPQWFKVTCHALALGAFAYVIYILYPSQQAEWDNQLADSINNAFRRPVWSLALCWLIFACVHGFGGPVNWFLCLRLWKFVARISYAMYLLHILVQEFTASSGTTTSHFRMDTMFAALTSDLVYTVAASIAACVLIEEPAFTLQKMLFRGQSKQEK